MKLANFCKTIKNLPILIRWAFLLFFPHTPISYTFYLSIYLIYNI